MGEASIWPGVLELFDCSTFTADAGGTSPGKGERSSQATAKITMPWPRANQKKVSAYPIEAIIIWIGMTVTTAPPPKPPAVRPTARPRRSGNHLTALPTHVA